MMALPLFTLNIAIGLPESPPQPKRNAEFAVDDASKSPPFSSYKFVTAQLVPEWNTPVNLTKPPYCRTNPQRFVRSANVTLELFVKTTRPRLA